MAYSVVKRKEEAMIGSRFGITSARMIRRRPSPETRAASTKSRLRRERVWARSTLDPYAHPVRATINPMTMTLVSAPGT